VAENVERDPFIESIASELRRPVRLDPKFDARVMSALDAPVIPLHAREVSRPWFLRSRTFSVSPLGALAAAAAIGFITVLGARATQSSSDTPPVVIDTPRAPVPPQAILARSANQTAPVDMQFLLLAPDADSVKIVGEFNDWDESQDVLTPSSAKGAWTTTVPLPPGRYEYQFLVYTKAGIRRIADPSAPKVASEFGSLNSIVTVVPGQ
jgi:hypothetical protein